MREHVRPLFSDRIHRRRIDRRIRLFTVTTANLRWDPKPASSRQLTQVYNYQLILIP